MLKITTLRGGLWLCLLLLFSPAVFAQKKYTISGYVREAGTLEQLPGVNVYVPNTAFGTSTNNYGFFSLTIPEQRDLTLVFSYVGYQRLEKRLSITANQELTIDLQPATQLQEVVVSAKQQSDQVSDSPQMSVIEVPVQQIKKIPALLGEKDVLKVIQLMPGVQKGTEGQSGLYVRGGGPDQNLLILDDATVYNANHLFGFFSVFNGDALKSVELQKGGFPARYGGRLSSVVEMQMKEGAKDALHGEVGVGIISSRAMIEAPIVKNKSSFIISGRRTYIDVLAQPFIRAMNRREGDTSNNTVGYYFYDLNAKWNYDFGPKNKIYLSGYFGKDRFYFRQKEANSDVNSGINWGNATATLRWNHLFSQKLFVNNSLIFSDFKFGVDTKQATRLANSTEPASEFTLQYYSKIQDVAVKSDFEYYPNTQHAIRFGALLTRHQFTPSALVLAGFSQTINDVPVPINTLEAGLYAEDVWQPINRLKIHGGLRISQFSTKSKNYVRPEPRLAVAYKVGERQSVKASYARMNQYIHLLSNTGIGLPTDLWVPTTDKVAPQQSEQIAAGFAHDFKQQGLSLTIEGYYKRMDNIISYKEGASFLGVRGNTSNGGLTWEDNITAGRGWSYGAEFLLQKKLGRFSGWAGYTLSWTKWQFPELNFGRVFYPRYDRRHDASLVGIYEIRKNITLSGTWVYGTGNALTLPQSNYYAIGHPIVTPTGTRLPSLPTLQVTEYGERNSFRAEPYHRLDIAVQFHKKVRLGERTWEIGVYNAYNRRNPFFYNLTTRYQTETKDYKTVLQRVSLLPIIPSISYSLKF